MRVITYVAGAVAAFAVAAEPLAAADAGARVSGPHVYKNLAVYFIHGANVPGAVPLTLQEALTKKTVRVIETQNVNELKIENTGTEEIFIQSGDIVKGGQQDRVLTVSMLLPSKSGQVPIASFCVEQGRWTARGKEDVKHFASAAEALPSREAKLAINMPKASTPPPADTGSTAGPQQPQRHGNRVQLGRGDDTSKRQQEVWAEVAKTQDKLSGSLKAKVAAPQSATSLQLALENDRVKTARAEYTSVLKPKGEAESDIVGYVFAVNGKLNSADLYPSNGLFKKMWEKLLTASATEAIGEAEKTAAGELPSVDAVKTFLATAEAGKGEEREIANLMKQEVRNADSALYVEAKRRDGGWVHRNYLAK